MNKEIELFASSCERKRVQFFQLSPFLSLRRAFSPAVAAYKNKQPSFPRGRKREFLITENFVRPRDA